MLLARDIELAFGDRMVLRGASVSLRKGDKVGLVGANGSGKSTLLRALCGHHVPDHGTIQIEGRRAWLDQEPELHGDTVAACAAAAIAWHQDLLDAFEAACVSGDEAGMVTLQDRLDQVGWEVAHQVDAMLERLGAPPKHARVSELSGGERRRVALAIALLGRPDVLLLDEPTNHLDAGAVAWLEAWLQGFDGALLLVTHDRYLLEAVAERIVEIERGQCAAYDGSYGDYLIARAERAARQEQAQHRHLKFLAREAAWAARSPAARSTKQKARLQRLDALQDQEIVRFDTGFELDLSTGQRLPSTLVELHGVTKAYDGRELLGGAELTLTPRDRLGIMGDNGAGKSTLLKILSGALTPDRGERVAASRLTVAVLDQQRRGLESPDGKDWTVFEAAGGGSSHVTMAAKAGASWQGSAGGRQAATLHVASFLERFLFPRESLDQPVSKLSGGERARLLLAKLLLKGANVILLDEPTNDLDLLTLRVLEEALLSFDGAAVVVTHDRAFLDRVCTAVVAVEDGGVQRYADRSQYVSAVQARAKASPSKAPIPATPRARGADQLSHEEREELAGIEAHILGLEAELDTLGQQMSDAGFWSDAAENAAVLQARAAALPGVIEAAYARWEQLEARS